MRNTHIYNTIRVDLRTLYYLKVNYCSPNTNNHHNLKYQHKVHFNRYTQFKVHLWVFELGDTIGVQI